MRCLVTKQKENSMINLDLMVRHQHPTSTWVVSKGLVVEVIQVALVDSKISAVIHFLAEDLLFSAQRIYLEISLVDGTRLLISWVMTMISSVADLVAEMIHLEEISSVTWEWEVSVALADYKIVEEIEEVIVGRTVSRQYSGVLLIPLEACSEGLEIWEISEIWEI